MIDVSAFCGDMVVFAVCLAFVGVGIYLLQQSLRFRRRGIVTVGKVIAIHAFRGRRGRVYHPIIRFMELSQGATIEFTESSGIRPLPQRFQVGAEVRVRYLPTNPHQAQLVWIWNSPMIALLVIGFSLLVAIFLVWHP